MTDIFTVSLADILPYNIANAPDIPNITAALDEALRSLSQETQIPLIIPNIDNAPSQSLEHIAVHLSSDMFALAENDSHARGILKGSILRHMKKGTAAEIIRALNTIGVEAKFIPWWKYGGRPYTFRIEADITSSRYMGMGQEKITQLITRLVNSSKAARSFMESLDARMKFTENIPLFHAMPRLISGHASIRLSHDDENPHGVLYYGGIQAWGGQHTVSLQRDRSLGHSIFTGTATLSSYSAEEWTDLDTMQELLLKFEQRIFSRIDSMERSLNSEISSRTDALDAKIDSVVELLRWQNVEDETQ